jgi:hypothetical protein
MNITAPQDQVNSSHDTKIEKEFNFELWAKQVRPLLLASLNKRGHRP